VKFEEQGGRGWRCELAAGPRIVHGPQHKWWKNGHKRQEGEYQHGLKVGPWRSFHTTGTLWEETDHLPNDVASKRVCHGNGALKAVQHYHAGKRDGRWSTFWDDGAKDSEGSYRRDVRVGKWQSWRRDGSLLVAGRYVDGKPHGRWTEQFGSHGTYDHGRRVGQWKLFRSGGGAPAIHNYVNGELHGRFTEVSVDGTLELEGHYVRGKRHGRWTFHRWTTTAVVAASARGAYKHGKQTGRWQWILDGKLRLDGSYRDGKRHGVWTMWSPAGAPEARGIYQHGKRSSGEDVRDPFPPPWER
jgi:antitoxin component YwqK of YwqJK toxin-antitoxin module